MKISPVSDFDYVVFGGTGDLALRKLYPSLLKREADGQLPAGARIIGASRAAKKDAEFITAVKENCEKHLGSAFPAKAWGTFEKRLSYCKVDATDGNDYKALKKRLDEQQRIRVFYLALAPSLFGATAENLHAVGLHENDSRIVLEKPVGRDLETFKEIDDQVCRFFEEKQIYRIDHYLGKETVQNLTALRFSNILFANIWNADNIDHIQITAAETVGLGARAGYYDQYGAMRDMVQNHLLQLLCLVAMEPPSKFNQDALRDEKLKVLKSLRPWNTASTAEQVVFGQYGSGQIDGKKLESYAEELGKDSRTETFVTLKTYVDNWRWSGVPFYLRTGKRMDEKMSEIVIQFKQVPHSIFGPSVKMNANRLVLRLQPNEGVSLELMIKDPGPGGMRLRDAGLDLSYSDEDLGFPDAYERLLLDVVRGNSTLFMRRDEVEAAWTWIGPLLDYWENSVEQPKPYKAGSMGPNDSFAMMIKDGRQWDEDMSA